MNHILLIIMKKPLFMVRIQQFTDLSNSHNIFLFVVNGTSGTWVETGTWATNGASMTTTNSKVIVTKTNQFFFR